MSLAWAQPLFDAISLGGLYALAALAIALLFGIMGLVNFAWGELIMVGAYTLTFSLTLRSPTPVLIGIVAFIIVTVALGQERLAFRPLRGANAATLLVSSFAVSMFLKSVAIMVWGARPRGTGDALAMGPPTVVAGLRIERLDLYTLVTTLVLLTLLVAFLKRTALGIHMRACAEDFQMARYLGVRANRVIAIAFVISAMLATAVTLLYVARIGNASPNIGLRPILVALVATVIGGMGNLVGAAVGGFVLAFLTVGIQAAFPAGVTAYRDAIAFAVVIAILLLRPQGLVPAQSTREW